MPRFRDTELSLSPSVPRKERVKDPKNIMRSVDPAALEMLAKYKDSGIITGFDRFCHAAASVRFRLRRRLLQNLHPGSLPCKRDGRRKEQRYLRCA